MHTYTCHGNPKIRTLKTPRTKRSAYIYIYIPHAKRIEIIPGNKAMPLNIELFCVPCQYEYYQAINLARIGDEDGN